MTYATLVVRKTDNGYNGVVMNDSDRGLFKRGDNIFNRKLHPFPAGSKLNVVVKFSKVGRRMVQKVTLIEDAPMETKPKSKGKAKEKTVVILTTSTGEGYITTPTMRYVPEPHLPGEIPHSVPKVVEPDAPAPTVKEHAPAPASALDGYFIDHDARLTFTSAYRISQANPERAVKVMMVGPSGYGKTTLPKLFAQAVGLGFMRMNCAKIRDPEEWFGYREARDGSTVFVRSQFASMVEAGNCVVVLDEFNRLEPWLHNTLFPLLDDDGCTVVHDETFRIGPNVIMVGTINTGYKYTGVFELDEALMNRFEFILEVGPLPSREEVRVLCQRTKVDKSKAETIVEMANILRENEVVCSTRTSLLVASMVVSGMTVREAYESAVVRRIPADTTGSNQRKKVVDLVNTRIGTLQQRPVFGDVFGYDVEPEPEVKATADYTFDKPTTQTLLLKPTGRHIPNVPVMKALRMLVLADLEGMPYTLSVRDAQKYVVALASSATAEVRLTILNEQEHLEEAMDALASAGISCGLI